MQGHNSLHDGAYRTQLEWP